MESFTDAEARSLRKMLSVQLRARLLGNLALIGVTAAKVADISREALSECMANLYILLKEQVDDPLSTIVDEGEPGIEVAPSALGGPDADAATQLEIVKLQLQLQRERQQHEREMQDGDLEMRRREAASAEQLKRDELELLRGCTSNLKFLLNFTLVC